MRFHDPPGDTPHRRVISPWGKCNETGSHHLAHHCADVAACFEVIATRPVFRSRLESAAGRPLTRIDLARLAVIVFLHDCGKLHPGFQAKGWPESAWQDLRHGHVQEGAAIFFKGVMKGQIAANLHVEALQRWGVSADLIFAVIAHHGRPFLMEGNATQRWGAVNGLGYACVASSAEIGAVLPKWFPEAFSDIGEALPNVPEFQHLLCGLVSLADWLGSDQRTFAFVAELDTNYMDRARQRAATAVTQIGLDVARWRAKAGDVKDFKSIAPGLSPRGAQSAVGEWPPDDQLVILEAETGSGKTEAALWRFAQLFAAGKVDSLYFALPTRAAAVQIHGRVNAAMKALFGPGAPEAVLAVPGYLMAGEIEGHAFADFEVRWDDDPLDEARLSRWAAENAKRYLAATIAVGTVDQVMLSALEVKHAHLRSASLCRSLVVIDEIHASDRYMSAVQEQVLKTHLDRGGFAMLMSATLGSTARARWLGNKRVQSISAEAAIATPYPAVWGGRGVFRHVASEEGRQKNVAMTLASSWSPEDAAQQAIDTAGQGARVLVIRNTVKAAMATFNAVLNAGHERLLWSVRGGPALHHSRFAPEDRKLLDGEVETALSGKQAIRPSGGVIVIGTQTLEQSLDICADLLITDLCPADVLLQRIGRLHRHALARPAGFETPRCIVLSPEGGLDRLAAHVFDNGLGMLRDGGGVYTNLHACELTRRLVIRHAEWVIPDMNRLLVESATHEDCVEALNAEKGKAWFDYWNVVCGRQMADTAGAKLVLLKVDEPFGELRFPGDDEKVRTRLGAEGMQIRFAEQIVGPFGAKISGVTLPAHWPQVINCNESVAPQTDGRGQLHFSGGASAFRYARRGLEREGS